MILSNDQTDALTEVVSIGVGRAAAVLNGMIDSHIKLQVPFVKIVSMKDLVSQTDGGQEQALSAVRLAFMGPFAGTAALVFPPDSASKLVSVLIGEEPGSSALDSEMVGTLTEVGNIVMNGVMGSIGNVLDKRIDYAVPSYMMDTIQNLVSNTQEPDPNATILMAQTRFTIEQLEIDGDVMLYFEVGSFDALLAALDEAMLK